MHFDLIKLVLEILGGGWAIYLFTENNRLKRAEWLEGLFEKFYETENYKACRTIIDSGKPVAISEIEGSDDEDKFTDYLNFFEFVLSLRRLNQIKRNEVEALFDYYLRNIGAEEGIMLYLKQNGFENLYADLDSFKKYDSK